MAKFVTLIGLIASLNLALFVFNLIPLLLWTAGTSRAPSGKA